MYLELKNLAQLKRALVRGAAFEISWPNANFRRVKGTEPQNRIVNIVQTNGIYSINPDAELKNGGRGMWLDYGKAAFWGFSGESCTLYSSTGKEPGTEIFTLRVLSGVDRTAQLEAILAAHAAREAAEAAREEAARLEAQEAENRRAGEVLDEAVKTLLAGELVENTRINLDGKETTVILALAARYGVDVPLSTKGYIRKNLSSIRTNGTNCGYYHTGGKAPSVCWCIQKIYVAAKWGMAYTLAAYREFCASHNQTENAATLALYIKWHEMDLDPQQIDDLLSYMDAQGKAVPQEKETARQSTPVEQAAAAQSTSAEQGAAGKRPHIPEQGRESNAHDRHGRLSGLRTRSLGGAHAGDSGLGCCRRRGRGAHQMGTGPPLQRGVSRVEYITALSQ